MTITTLLIGSLLVASLLTFIALGFFSFVPWIFLALIAAIIYIIKSKEKSNFVTWQDSYSVGIELIDNDHKHLLTLINRFQTAIYYNTGEKYEQEALDELIEYTKTHFAREENLMEEYGYPDLESHKAQHHKMVLKVESFIADHNKQGYKSLQTIADFLKDWLIKHIQGSDQEYSEFLHDKGVQ